MLQSRGARAASGNFHLSGRLEKDDTMKKTIRFLRLWGPALILMAFIFFASGTPGNDLPDLGFLDVLVKKGGHMLGYGLLAAAYLRGLTGGGKASRVRVLSAILMAALYAATDEFHQRFTPGRTPSVSDVGVDTVGAILGATLSAWIHARR